MTIDNSSKQSVVFEIKRERSVFDWFYAVVQTALQRKVGNFVFKGVRFETEEAKGLLDSLRREDCLV